MLLMILNKCFNLAEVTDNLSINDHEEVLWIILPNNILRVLEHSAVGGLLTPLAVTVLNLNIEFFLKFIGFLFHLFRRVVVDSQDDLFATYLGQCFNMMLQYSGITYWYKRFRNRDGKWPHT